MIYFHYEMTEKEAREKYAALAKEFHPDKVGNNQTLKEVYSNIKLEYEDWKVIKSRWSELKEYFSKKIVPANTQNLQNNMMQKLFNMMDREDFLPNVTKIFEVMFGNAKK